MLQIKHSTSRCWLVISDVTTDGYRKYISYKVDHFQKILTITATYLITILISAAIQNFFLKTAVRSVPNPFSRLNTVCSDNHFSQPSFKTNCDPSKSQEPVPPISGCYTFIILTIISPATLRQPHSISTYQQTAHLSDFRIDVLALIKLLCLPSCCKLCHPHNCSYTIYV